jgi:alginate O-acetyltransferase complex protein AlgI
VLFNSYEFIFLFLPVTLAVFFALGARGLFTAASAWLAVASVGFYSYWNPWHVPLVLGSITANYWLGTALFRRAGKVPGLLALGVAGNLLLLGICKYRPFVIENLNSLLGLHWPVPAQVLPLGVSFFTFTQIAFLVDAHRGSAQFYPGLRYGLFVLFFPHLIAGPIVHHYQLIPQLGRREIFRFQPGPFACGLTLFTLGLAKKVIFADTIAKFARPVFAGAAAGTTPDCAEAWVGALSYTLQLYFDFSGYSDMALGLARMFNVKFPANFNSPYKAASIVDFWRRWHITLSLFLRDYLYFPLGGSRCGKARHYVNLFITMLLGGIWHGAGWTFAIWGAWHGACLCVNHLWRARGTGILPVGPAGVSPAARLAAGAFTFLCVVIGWVFFKAASVDAALRVLGGMANLPTLSPAALSESGTALAWIAALLAIVWLAPNTQQLLAKHEPALHEVAPGRVSWQPTARWALIVAVIFVLSVLHLSQITEFIYFQF